MQRPPIAAKPRVPVIAALDIGTSKVACLIARLDTEGRPHIIGIGHQLSRGIKGSVITDITEAETSIVAAVHAAEQMAGVTLESVMVNLSCHPLTSRQVTVELALSGEAVGERDIIDILSEAQASIASHDSEIVHCFPIGYMLDGSRHIRDPRQMVGSKLGADLHLITTPIGTPRNMANCVGRCHLNVSEYAAAPHAAGLAVLEPDEKDLGVTVIDMGGGTTGFAIFSGGADMYVDTVPIGGIHVTHDIARGLSTHIAHAERLKILHGSAIATTQDEQVMIDVPQLGENSGGMEEPNPMPRSMLVGIIRPRLEEMFEIIRSKLDASGLDRQAGRRVVLTGGASQLLGVRDLAARILSKQVRSGRPPMLPGLADATSGPAFAAVIGMLRHAVERPMEEAFFHHARRSPNLIARMKGWMQRLKEYA